MPTVLLVRHAQASFGGPDYDVLSELGHRQSAVLGKRLRRLGEADQVHVGRMQRQRHTAELALGTPRMQTATVDPRWDEYDHEELLTRALADAGDQEQLAGELAEAEDPRRVFQARFDAALDRWISGEHDGEYTESYPAFRARVRAALEDLLGAAERSSTAVVVTSGGVISALCADLLGLDPRGWARLNRVLVNTSVTKVAAGRSGTTLLTVNDHAHLETADPALLTYR